MSALTAVTFEAEGKITGSANLATALESNRTVILFGSYDNNLYCLDAETGELVFKHPAESYINGAIAVADNVAVFGSCDANIYQVPISHPEATVTIEAGSYVAANPAIADGIIYASMQEAMTGCSWPRTQKPKRSSGHLKKAKMPFCPLRL
ncbi:MAG: PQQ-binding-like beta-propeller repeat protein [Planctomycetota bacterium]|jgi:outer membrane protein assembly factor BamB